MKDFVPGYHSQPIAKGVLGEASKIKEECDEFLDAMADDVKLMALHELSDLVGAIRAFLAKHHPSFTLEDLQTMSLRTERAFRNGRR